MKKRSDNNFNNDLFEARVFLNPNFYYVLKKYVTA